jgi:hypothetical protein
VILKPGVVWAMRSVHKGEARYVRILQSDAA